ncbi:hypothetical protein FGIG_10170 [Fasciola gigantica]|uniref:Integral membrane protein GPR155 n=1 Tax=Fasciola gigantica TaxID=46835 RepID=A0A504YCI2_FASGI|nr:hypothetical protein FGIG_10170 [Fasciola gigantica]
MRLRHQTWFYLVGFVTPVLATSLLLLTSRRERVKDVSPAFQYGKNQLITSLVVLLVNTIGTLVFIIWYVRLGSSAGDTDESIRKEISHFHQPASTERRVSMRNPCPVVSRSFVSQAPEQVTAASSTVNSASAPDFTGVVSDPTDSQHGSQSSLIPVNLSLYCQCASPTERRRCHRLLVRYGRLCTNPFGRSTTHSSTTLSTLATRIQQSSFGSAGGSGGVGGSGTVDDHLTGDLVGNCGLGDELEFHHQRHLIFILVLSTTMFFGICLCTWRLVQEPASGVYLVLEFLDGVFNFGQGIVLFVIFGLDADLIILPIRRFVGRHVRRWCGAVLDTTALGSIVEAPDPATLKERCVQFVTFHMTSCCTSIAKTPSVGRHVRRWCGAVLDTTALGSIVEAPDPATLKERCVQFVTFHMTSCCTSIAKTPSPVHPTDKLFTEEALVKWLQVAGLVHSDREGALFVDLLESDGLVAPVDASSIVPTSAQTSTPESRLLRFTEAAFELHSTEQELLEF